MSNVSLVLFALGVFGVLLPAAGMWALRALRVRRRGEAEGQVRGRILKLDDQVGFRGTTGHTSMAGTGCLIATDEELLYTQWWPRSTIRIPRSAIVAVELATAHLGRAGPSPLLRLRWRDGVEPRASAWAVREADEWMRVLDPVR